MTTAELKHLINRNRDQLSVLRTEFIDLKKDKEHYQNLIQSMVKTIEKLQHKVAILHGRIKILEPKLEDI